MTVDDSAFREMARDFLHIIIARERPVAVSDAERIFLNFLVSEDEQGRI